MILYVQVIDFIEYGFKTCFNEFDWSSFVLGLKAMERFNLEELDSAVELLFGFIILVLGSGNSNSHESWNVSASSWPKESVQLGINSNIL